MDTAVFDLIITLFLTVLCYCTIPTILRFTLAKKKKLSKRGIIGIVVTNALLIFCAINIPLLTIYGYDSEIASPYPAVIWGIANYWILYSANTKHHDSDKSSSGSKFSAGSSTYTYISQENCAQNTEDAVDAGATPKQHPRSFLIILVCLCIALMISTAAVSCYAYITINHQNDRIKEIKESCEASSSYSLAAIQYMESAVIVKDGDDEHYHRMNCPQLGVEYEYLAFNIEAAEGMGYSECPICFELSMNDYIKTYF